MRPTNFDRSRAERYRHHELWSDRTVDDVLRATVADRAEHVALLDAGRELTYRELDRAVGRVAAALRGRGVTSGDVVSYQLPNWWEAVVAHLAVVRLGAVANPLHMIYRQHELRFILDQCRAKVVFAPEHFRNIPYAANVEEAAADLDEPPLVVTVRGGGAVTFERLLDEGGQGGELDGDVAGASTDPDDVCLLLYTSGTTAAPKGVLHSHNTILRAGQDLVDLFALSGDDRLFVPSPFTHITGLLYVQIPLSLGGSAVLMDHWDPDEALRLVVEHRCTYTGGATPFIRGLIDAAVAGGWSRDDVPLRCGTCGGADVPPGLIAEVGTTLGASLVRVYGLTEGVTVTASPPDDTLDHRGGTDGRALPGMELRLVDDGVDVPTGTVGEILVRGPSNFLGYFDATLNAETIDPDGWVRTGDLAVADQDGYIQIRGRKKDIIIRGGENISVREVEDLLADHPAISEVAIVGMPDPVMGERACAYVTPRPGETVTLDDLVAFLRAKQIAPQKLPERLEVLPDGLPKTPSGKVQKYRLREDVARRADAPGPST